MSAMKEKMHTGELYLPEDDEIVREQMACLDRLYTFNQTRPTETEKRQALLSEMFAEIGESCYIEPPFHALPFRQQCLCQFQSDLRGRHPYLCGGVHHDRPECHHRHGRASDFSCAAGESLSV